MPVVRCKTASSCENEQHEPIIQLVDPLVIQVLLNTPHKSTCIDGLQMSVKRPTSRGQTWDQKVTEQWTFHLERSKSFYLEALMVRT